MVFFFFFFFFFFVMCASLPGGTSVAAPIAA
jgi:hypothetical protein